MPLYFFDIRDNEKFIGDETGFEIEDFEALKVAVAKSLAELANDVLPGSTRRSLAVEVRDENGPVLVALLTFEAIILKRPKLKIFG